MGLRLIDVGPRREQTDSVAIFDCGRTAGQRVDCPPGSQDSWNRRHSRRRRSERPATFAQRGPNTRPSALRITAVSPSNATVSELLVRALRRPGGNVAARLRPRPACRSIRGHPAAPKGTLHVSKRQIEGRRVASLREILRQYRPTACVPSPDQRK